MSALASPRIRPARGEQPRSRMLRLVGPARSRARRAPFVVVVLGLLSAGLVGLIVMSTVLQAQSFQLSTLSQQADALATQQQAMTREVERMQSPSEVAARAMALGMVPNANPVFLRLSDGKVVGKPSPAEAGSNPAGGTR